VIIYVFKYKIISIVRPRTDPAQNESYVEMLKSRGFENVLVYHPNKNDAEILDKIQQITGKKGVDHVLDCVGGDTGVLSLKALKPTGTCLYYGIMANQGINLDLMALLDFILHGKKILGVSIQNWWFGSKTVEQRKQIFGEVMDLIVKKR